MYTAFATILSLVVLLIASLARPALAIDPEASSESDDGLCLLQTHTEMKFKSNPSPVLSSAAQDDASEKRRMEWNAEIANDHADAMNMPSGTSNSIDDSDVPETSKLPGFSLLSTVRESHALGVLFEIASQHSSADSSPVLFVGTIGVVIAIVGTIAVCTSMDSSKADSPQGSQKAPRGSHQPSAAPPRSSISRPVERRSNTPGMMAGRRETPPKDRGAAFQSSSFQSATSTGASSFRTPPTMQSESPRNTIATAQEPLVASLVVSHGEEAAYLLPDLGHMTRPVEAFDILNPSGTCILGVVVNDGSEDPGILLHVPRTADGAGLPLAFIGTSMALRHAGTLPIARPSVKEKHGGEFFANLNRDHQGGYSVRKDGLLMMRFEGDFVGRTIWLYDRTMSQAIGSTRPCGEAFGQIRFELHISVGKDAALAILCLLAISRFEYGRATIQSSSQGSGQSLQADPGVGGGGRGPMFSLGGLKAM